MTKHGQRAAVFKCSCTLKARLITCCGVMCCATLWHGLQAAVEVRKQVNQLDNLTTSKAVDALLNAETVALFGNRQLEVRWQGCSQLAARATQARHQHQQTAIFAQPNRIHLADSDCSEQ